MCSHFEMCVWPLIRLLFILFSNDATHYYDVIYMSHGRMRLTFNTNSLCIYIFCRLLHFFLLSPSLDLFASLLLPGIHFISGFCYLVRFVMCLHFAVLEEKKVWRKLLVSTSVFLNTYINSFAISRHTVFSRRIHFGRSLVCALI